MRSRTVRYAGASAAALVLLATALAGCSLGPLGSGTAASGSASPSPTRTDSVSTDDSASPKAGPGGSIADPTGSKNADDYPCNLYSPATISDFAGFTVTKATAVTAVGEPDQKSCLYDSGDGSHEFATEIALSNGPAHLSAWKLIQDTGGPVADVIDADDTWGDDSELAAVYGNVFIEAGDQSDASNESATLANIGVDKLTLMVGGLYSSTLK
jgi:hypothetical protein